MTDFLLLVLWIYLALGTILFWKCSGPSSPIRNRNIPPEGVVYGTIAFVLFWPVFIIWAKEMHDELKKRLGK